MIRLAGQNDLEFISQHDYALNREVLTEKIGRREVYIAEDGGLPVGFARYHFFYDLYPFLALIHILEPYRRKGFGAQLMAYWEQEMKKKGHGFVLTSTQADEEAQFFYRKLGYADSGAFLIPGQTATELVFLKRL